MVQFIITPETAPQLERRKADLEAEMARLRDEHQKVCRQLEAIPLFLADMNGGGAAASQSGNYSAASGRDFCKGNVPADGLGLYLDVGNVVEVGRRRGLAPGNGDAAVVFFNDDDFVVVAGGMA